MTNTEQINALQTTMNQIELAVFDLENLKNSMDSVDQLYLKQLGSRLFKLVDYVDNFKGYRIQSQLRVM
jgi:hypothetical protein